MITGKQKTVTDVARMISPYEKVLVLGCGTCTTVCFAGGEKETAELASSLHLLGRKGKQTKEITEHTVKRQCEWEYLDEIAALLEKADAVVSLACGIGAQAIAERYPDIHVLPGLDTCFMGLPQEPGVWSERCLACGDCIIDTTAGICPITRCAKGLLNGPCGGSVAGRCEISADIPCAWQLIHDRLAARGQLGRLDDLPPARDWSTSHSGGPRRIVRQDLKTKM